MIDTGKLMTELNNAGLVVASVSFNPSADRKSDRLSTTYKRADGTVAIDWLSAPTAQQQTTAGNVVAVHDGSRRMPRALAAIVADLAALTPTQQASVWADVQQRLIARFVQDNPAYLVAPAFDATVNVPGDQPGDLPAG